MKKAKQTPFYISKQTPYETEILQSCAKEWLQWLEQDNHIVAEDTIGEYTIRTVCIGVDVGSVDGEVRLFKTEAKRNDVRIVNDPEFYRNLPPLDEAVMHSSTWKDALWWHQGLVSAYDEIVEKAAR